MRNEKTRKIAFDAIFVAIIIILTFVPYIGFIPLGPVSFTTITIPVFVGAYIFDWKRGTFYGFMFGVSSMVRSFMSYVTPADPFFQNPLVSVLPRVIFGLVTGLVFMAVKKIKKVKMRRIVLPISIFLLSLFHSVITLVMLGIFNNEIFGLMLGILGTNGIVEAIFAALVVPSIILALEKYVYEFNPNLVPETRNDEVNGGEDNGEI
jgi:uncharacterized membrane protein